ncbi:MAG: hypothetical protein J6N71_03030 [Muribaculaceae bacterium]|nr:hypothetical protein [Muribaculaceae bacterium]
MLNHLAVGLQTGLGGFGVDVAMPLHRIVTVRAGIVGNAMGDIKFKAINTATNITQMQLVEDDAIKQAKMTDKVELAIKPRFWNAFIMAEVHPFPTPFYFAAGLFAGNRTFLHFRNTNDGALQPLYDANQKVEDYNQLYHTNYPPVGLKFGDYVFTADENYNIDVKMRTWAVKPYLGIGFGQSMARHHRLSFAVDAGLMFWGSPQFVLNNGKKIKSSSKESGITHFISWFSAYPMIQLRLAYKIF